MRRRAAQEPTDEWGWAALAAADPTFAERYDADQRRQAAEVGALAPVVDQLVRFGIAVTSIRDLQRPGAPIEAAAPVLIRWLPTINQPDAKRRVILILGDPRAGADAARALVDEFRRVAPNDDGDPVASVRATIGSALSAHDCDPIAEDLLAIASDRTHGMHRGMIVHNLSRLRARRADAIAALRTSLDDPQMRSIAAQALGTMRATEAEPDLDRLVDDPDPTVRAAVKSALRRMRNER